MGRVILIILIAVGSPVVSSARSPVVLTAAADQYPLGRMLEYLEDSAGTLTIDDVASPEMASRFVLNRTSVPSFGFTKSVYWVRITLLNNARTTDWRLMLGFPNMQDAAYHLPRADGTGFDVIRTGTRHPFDTRDIPYHHLVFDLPLPAGTETTVYLRFRNNWAMTFPLTLLTPDAFIRYSRLDYLLLGLAYGAILLLIIYNLFLWFALQERNYGYFVGVLACMLPAHVVYEGLAGEYWWPDSPHLTDLGILVFIPAISILGMMFAISFLNTRKRSPAGHLVIVGFIGAWGLLITALPFLDSSGLPRVVMPLRLANSLVFTGINYLIWRRGYRPARYFFLAWLMTAMTFIPFAMVRLGIMPSFSLAEQGIRFGMILTGLFLSFALADRIQNLQREIFEHQKTESRLQLAKASAEAASQAKSRFLSMMSHELRTPLNAILGYAELLQRKTRMDALAYDGLKTIEHSGHHLLQLIEDLLDLAKIEAGKIEPAAAPFSLPEQLDRVAAMIRVRAHEKGLAFVWNPPPDLPDMVVGDARRLRQVLLNLLGNAVKFTREGRVCLDVVSLEANHLRFSIEDTGPGVPPDRTAEIFSPFVRLEESGDTTEGTGLGLSLSRSMVRLMGGDLHVESAGAGGCAFRFTVSLPEVADREASPLEMPPPIVGIRGNPKRVLIVDDDADNRRMLGHTLESLGFQVAEAENGREALFRAEQEVFDGVLMDLMMPVQDGAETSRRMRRSPGLARLNIIIMTADAAMDPETLKADTGCDGVLIKPLRREALLARLKSCLNLEWVYGDAEIPDRTRRQRSIPPSADLDTLRNFAGIGAYTELMEALTRLRRQDPEAGPFADDLLGLLSRFQFEAIVNYLGESPGPS